MAHNLGLDDQPDAGREAGGATRSWPWRSRGGRRLRVIVTMQDPAVVYTIQLDYSGSTM
jgi:hypothetical protein